MSTPLPETLREAVTDLKPKLRGWLHAVISPLAFFSFLVLLVLADSVVVRAGAAVFMKVTIRFDGDTDTETFLLGSRELLTLDSAVDLDVYSPTSPLGAAIAGKSVGDSASYQAPNGATITVHVVGAVPF